MEPVIVALITVAGGTISAVIGVIANHVGAQATRDSAEITSRGEEWERILQTVREVSRSELELRDSQIERLRRDVDEQSERMEALEVKYEGLRREHSHLWSLFSLAMETLKRWPRPPARNLELLAQVHGADLYEAARLSGRGVIVAAPHFGNWELLNQYLASRGPIAVVYRPPESAVGDEFLQLVRGVDNVRQVRAEGPAVRQLWKVLILSYNSCNPSSSSLWIHTTREPFLLNGISRSLERSSIISFPCTFICAISDPSAASNPA